MESLPVRLTPCSLMVLAMQSLTRAENGRFVRLTPPLHEDAPNVESIGLLPSLSPLFTLWASPSPALPLSPRVGTYDWSSILFFISAVDGLTLGTAPSGISLWIFEMLFSSQRAWVLHVNSFTFHNCFSALDCKSQIRKIKIKQFLFHNNPTILKVMSVSAELGKGDIYRI